MQQDKICSTFTCLFNFIWCFVKYLRAIVCSHFYFFYLFFHPSLSIHPPEGLDSSFPQLHLNFIFAMVLKWQKAVQNEKPKKIANDSE